MRKAGKIRRTESASFYLAVAAFAAPKQSQSRSVDLFRQADRNRQCGGDCPDFRGIQPSENGSVPVTVVVRAARRSVTYRLARRGRNQSRTDWKSVLRESVRRGKISIVNCIDLGWQYEDSGGNFSELLCVPDCGADVNDDTRLIDEALAGDSGAFGQLVQKYQDRLFNTLVHVVGNREEAEDIVQDAFVQAFLKLDSFRGASAFYTWLYRIAFNLSVSRHRRRRPEVSVDAVRESTGDEPIDTGNRPEDRILRQEQVDHLLRAMDGLNQQHRAILVLREMEGYCYQTISHILEVPVGTVRSRLHRARMQLREELKGVLEEYQK